MTTPLPLPLPLPFPLPTSTLSRNNWWSDEIRKKYSCRQEGAPRSWRRPSTNHMQDVERYFCATLPKSYSTQYPKKAILMTGDS